MRTFTLHAILSGFALSFFTCHVAAAPSFWCNFTEPFVSVATARDRVRIEGADISNGRVSGVATQQSGSLIVISGRLADGKELVLKINPGEGSDGMSEQDFPYVGVLSGAITVTGGCVKLADGTDLRQVVGVASNDVLNVRARPNGSAQVLARAYPKGFVWLKPGAAQNGWVRVSAVLQPKGEQGAFKSVDGWVRAKFLGLPK